MQRREREDSHSRRVSRHRVRVLCVRLSVDGWVW